MDTTKRFRDIGLSYVTTYDMPSQAFQSYTESATEFISAMYSIICYYLNMLYESVLGAYDILFIVAMVAFLLVAAIYVICGYFWMWFRIRPYWRWIRGYLFWYTDKAEAAKLHRDSDVLAHTLITSDESFNDDCVTIVIEADKVESVVGGVEHDQSLVKDRRHRRLPHKKSLRNDYVGAVIAEIKMKLGTPVYRDANVAVVRRLARSIMEAHGVRPTHQVQVINTILKGVFIPSQDEIDVSDMLSRPYAVDARSRVNMGNLN